MTHQETLFHFLREETRFTVGTCRTTLVLFFILLQFLRFALYLSIPLWIDAFLLTWLLTTYSYESLIKKSRSSRDLTLIQLGYFVVEIVLVTGVIHFAGLTHWFGAIFYLFTIIYSGFLMESRWAYGVSIIAGTSYAALVVMESYGWLHHYPSLGFTIESIDNPGNWALVLILIAVSTFFVIEYTVTRFAANLRRQKQHYYSLSHQHETLKTSRRQLQEELTVTRRRAATDGLTGLYNHVYFKKRLAVEFSMASLNGTSLSVIFLDLDHFKNYNDTYGHMAGDEAISRFAQFIKKNAREGDIAARYGGEEFTLLLPRTKAADAYVIIERLRKAFQEEPGYSRSMTFSAGIAAYPDHADSAEALLNLADNALYHAKENGRDQVILFDPLLQA